MNKESSSMIVSYLTIRRSIGILGILIPIVMVLGSLFGEKPGIQPTISNFYYLNVRDLFVGINCAVAIFLLCYRGYWKWFDIATSVVAGLGLLGASVFPMETAPLSRDVTGVFRLDGQLSNTIHIASAAAFFVTIAVISIFIFTMSTAKKMTPEKKIRNVIYVVCGAVIFVSLALILAYMLYMRITGTVPAMDRIHPLFFLESVSLFAFGISWLVKGETLWKDKKKKS